MNMNKITLKRLEINDFCIIGQADLKFSGSPELVYIRGVNKDTPHASSNGAGKSTILNAITWCLYGCDTQGKPIAAEAIRSGCSGCHVGITVDIDGDPFVIRRTRGTTSVSGSLIHTTVSTKHGVIEPTEVAQRWISATFGVQDVFLAAHMHAYEDGYQPYALGSDKEKKTLFDKLLGLGYLDEIGSTINGAYSKLEARVGKIKAGLKRYTAMLWTFNNSTETNAQEARKALSQLRASILDTEKQVDAAKAAVDKLYMSRLAAHEAYHKANDALIDYTSTLRALEAVIEAQRFKVDSVRNRTTCGVCGSKIDKTNWKKILGPLWDEYVGHKHQLKELVNDKGDIEDTKVRVARLKTGFDTAIATEQKEIRNHHVLMEKLKSQKETEESCSQALEGMSNMGRRRAEKTAKASSIIDSLTDSLSHRELELEDMAFWKEGFGRNGVKAYRLAALTPALNKIAATISNNLFGDGTVVVYSMQTQLKSGEYRDKFGVTLCKDGVEILKPSAGQAARRDLIHLLAIAKLAKSIAASRFMFTALDEAFRTVDTSGVHAAVTLLRHMSKEFGTVLVVEHDDDLASQFDREILVTREGNVSACV